MTSKPIKRAGRPVLIAGGSAVLAVHVPISHKAILQAEATERRWPISEVLRAAIAQYISRDPLKS